MIVPLRTEGVSPVGFHRVLQFDSASGTGECSVCGTTRIRDRGKKGLECRTKPRAPRGPRSRKPDPYDAVFERNKRLKRLYGLTSEDVAVMLADQGGVCAICLIPPDEPVVDHDHLTGKVRGILCHRCNLALGMLRDDTATVQRAVNYLSP